MPAVASVAVALAGAGIAAADATDDYPIPNRILRTSCTPEQILAAVRDVRPVYYERYLIDYNNKSPDLQQAVLCAVELALESGTVSKPHILNLLKIGRAHV